jgi:hypothetical protein
MAGYGSAPLDEFRQLAGSGGPACGKRDGESASNESRQGGVNDASLRTSSRRWREL